MSSRWARGLLAAMLAPLPAAADAEALRVLNWTQYLAPGTLEAFTEATGIAVILDTYESGATVARQLMARGSGYDVVIVSSEYLGRLIASGAVQPLLHDQLPRLADLDAAMMARLATLDPGHRHAVPYHWGMTGLGIDREAVAAQLDGPIPTDWSLLFDPSIAARLEACGIGIVDEPEEALAAALQWLGHDPNDPGPGALDAAFAALDALVPRAAVVHSSLITPLVTGEVCAVLGWSTDILWAMDEAGDTRTIEFVLPSEGGIVWFDVFTVPVDAARPDAAHAFIDFMLSPEMAAAAVNHNWAGSVVPAGMALADPAVRDHPSLAIDADRKDSLAVIRSLPPEDKARLDTLWTRWRLGLSASRRAP